MEIVNPATDGTCARGEMLGGPKEPSERLHVFREERCVERYARILFPRAPGEVVRQEQNFKAMGSGCSDPVAATWSIGGKLVNGVVEAIKPDPGSRVTVVTDGDAAFNVVHDGKPSPRDLVASLREATGLVAQVDVGQPALVVGLSTANLDDPNAVPLLTLIPPSTSALTGPSTGFGARLNTPALGAGGRARRRWSIPSTA